ncbi:MAG: DNA polymerase III subunit delta [Erysipelotrichaceae bacterium]|nr:DNA polymerase III subunit delta [Erysipelotrichaceae bacterium]
MNIVLYGDEKYLIQQRLEKLKKKYHISQDNMKTYWCNETPMKEIIDDALTFPFLDDYKMIVVKNPLFLTTKKQKDVNDKDIELFLDYITHDNPTTIFVIYHDEKNFDDRKKVVKTLRKNADFYNFEKLDYHQIYKATYQSIKKRNCTIDDDAMNLFISRVPSDLLTISQEVNKLCLYTNHITTDTINLLVPKQLEDNVFELTKAILNKELDKSISIYQDLIRNKEEPIKLIVLIANSMRLLYQVKLLDRKGYNDREIGNILSINPYRLKYIRQDGKDFDINELLKKMDELSKLDVDIKTGKIDRYKGLELFIIRIGGEN